MNTHGDYKRFGMSGAAARTGDLSRKRERRYKKKVIIDTYKKNGKYVYSRENEGISNIESKHIRNKAPEY